MGTGAIVGGRRIKLARARTDGKTGSTEEVKHTNAVSGVNSLGFMTMVQPHASAGATFQALQRSNVTLWGGSKVFHDTYHIIIG